MENLYIWFNRELDEEVYPLSEDYILKSKFEIDKPKKYYKENWKQGKLPNELYLIITKKKYKKIYFDFYFCDELKIVSDELLVFLNNNGIDEKYYEKSVLHIFDLKGQTLTEKNYFALRFKKDDKDYFSFNEETKELAIDSIDSYFSFYDEDFEGEEIQKEDDTGFYLYPDIELKKIENGKNVFSLFEFYYRDCLIFNENIKNYVLEHFTGTEIYKINDFKNIVNHYNFEELPKKNKYRIYK